MSSDPALTKPFPDKGCFLDSQAHIFCQFFLFIFPVSSVLSRSQEWPKSLLRGVFAVEELKEKERHWRFCAGWGNVCVCILSISNLTRFGIIQQYPRTR